MNAPIRDAFYCSSRKPMRRDFASGFPRALLSLSQEKSSGVEIAARQNSELFGMQGLGQEPIQRSFDLVNRGTQRQFSESICSEAI